MSVLYSEKIMCSEVELMETNMVTSGSHSSPEMEMMLERFIHNYGSSYSSSDQEQEQEQEQEHEQEQGVLHQQHQNHGHGFSGVGSDFETKFGVGNGHVNVNPNCHLIRQSSSPPDFLSHSPLENGFGAMRGGGRVYNQLSLSSGSPTCSRHLPRIAENGNDSWDNSSFGDLKRARDHTDVKMFSSSTPLQIQDNRDFGNRGSSHSSLTHHLSLPKNFGMPNRSEKILHFDSSVPCKMRAKRGFATHPRSIAERLRRTRISERMRRLEDLFPNIDKQTSIADKLELAVEFIKDLQKQVKTLTDTKAKCSCSSIQKQHSNPSA